MIDSPAEIVRSYRMAADPKKQIKVLAELNACSVKEIRQVLVGEGVLPRETEVPEEPKTTGNPELDKMVSEGQGALEEMRRLNDSIQDAAISAQIERLSQVSDKIFQQVQKNPSQLPQIRKFMSYYLPTTLKLLRAYDDMSHQGVQGENITGTMERVRGMMSTIVTAFERQLDSLFGDQALDISTDITVLDNMMAREGLSDDPIHRTQEKPDDGPQDDGIQLEL